MYAGYFVCVSRRSIFYQRIEGMLKRTGKIFTHIQHKKTLKARFLRKISSAATGKKFGKQFSEGKVPLMERLANNLVYGEKNQKQRSMSNSEHYI